MLDAVTTQIVDLFGLFTPLDFFPNQENRIMIHDITLILSGNEIRRTQNAAT